MITETATAWNLLDAWNDDEASTMEIAVHLEGGITAQIQRVALHEGKPVVTLAWEGDDEVAGPMMSTRRDAEYRISYEF